MIGIDPKPFTYRKLKWMAAGAYQPHADVIAHHYYCTFGQPIDSAKLNPFCVKPKPRKLTARDNEADTEFFRMQWESMFKGDDA